MRIYATVVCMLACLCINCATGVNVPGPPTLSHSVTDPTTMIKVDWVRRNNVVELYQVSWWPSDDSTNLNSKNIYPTSGGVSFNYVIDGLTPGQSYYVQVAVKTSAGLRFSVKVMLQTFSVIAPPTLTSSVSDPTTMKRVDWQKQLDIVDVYVMSWWVNGQTPQSYEVTNIKGQTSYSYIIEGLTPGESYLVKVEERSSIASGLSVLAKLRTNPPTPTNVELLQPTDGDKSTRLNVTWKMPSSTFHVASYNITLSLSAHQSISFTFYAGGNTPTQYLFENLTPMTNYVAIVQAVSPSEGVPETLSQVSSPSNERITAPLLPPTNLRLSDSVSDPTTMIRVEWDKPQDIDDVDGYKISWFHATNESFISQHNVSDDVRSYTITNLSPGYNYSVDVEAVYKAGLASTIDTWRTTPSKATNLSLVQARHNKTNQLHLKWVEPDGKVDGYEVKAYQGTSYTLHSTSTTTTTIIIGLVPGAAYTATVTAISDGVHGAESARSNPARTDPPTPTNVELLQPTDGDKSTRLNVTWKMPSSTFHVASYNITLSLSAHRSISFTFNASENSPTQYLVENLTPMTSYVATVQAVSPSEGTPETQSEVSSPSNEKNTAPLLPPTNLRLSDSVSDPTTMIRVEWDKPQDIDDVDGYKISWFYAFNESFISQHNVSDGVRSYNITDLSPGYNYSVDVEAVYKAGLASTIDTWRTTPSKETNLSLIQAINHKTNQLHLTWVEPEGKVDEYEVKVYQGTSYTLQSTSTTTTTIIIGLVPGAAYTATVTAISDGVHGAESDKSNPARTDPPTPTNVELLQPTDGDKSTRLNVTWKMPSSTFHVATYKIVLTSRIESNTYDVNESSFQSYLVENLTPGLTYTITVQAVSSSDVIFETFSNISLKSNAKTINPFQPSYNVSLLSNSLHITWIKPKGNIDGYILEVFGLKPIKLNSNATSYKVEGLYSSTEYSVGLYSFVNALDGELIKSDASFKTYSTLDPESLPTSFSNELSGVIPAILGVIEKVPHCH
ncbi:fibronectin-like isoform X2 [Clavelina lepadiformis]|uniref:fibronectin-like isoform X2 n=1 Tax=Clavelina lepadiformis TaxID=159417 RepID=UPI004040F574